MPTMVTLEPNPLFLAGKDKDGYVQANKAAYAEAVKRGPFEVEYSTALDNIALSRGMYRLAVADPAKDETPVRKLEEYTNDELKLALVSMGIKTEKQMKRNDIIDLIYKKMGEIEIVGDDDEDAES